MLPSWSGLGAMIKLDQAPRSWLAQRAIGAGFQSVLFADVRTADDARECVRVSPAGHARTAWGPTAPPIAGTPTGARRLAPTTSGRSKEIVIVLMIEKRQAVEQPRRDPGGARAST